MGWIEYLLAFAVFFATHSIPLRPAVRTFVVDKIGRAAFGIAYSALSLGVLAWLIAAAGRAPYVELWAPAPWQAHLALSGMAVACLVVALALGRPNPFSFGGGRDAGFDPSKPGLVRWIRHPLLIALAIWAGVHVVPNGDLAHVLLFGGFAAFAVLGRRLVERRKRQALQDRWDDLADAVARGPWYGLGFRGRELAARLLAGVLLYAGLLALHPILFGVHPIAWSF